MTADGISEVVKRLSIIVNNIVPVVCRLYHSMFFLLFMITRLVKIS